MTVESAIQNFDSTRETHLADLLTFLRFQTISAQAAHVPDMRNCADWLADQLSRAGLDACVAATDGHPVVLADSGPRDTGPTILKRGFGFSWGVGGWLLFQFLGRTDPAIAQRMRERVAAEMTTTFASHYTASISLADALKPEVAAAYQKKATGSKYLITP